MNRIITPAPVRRSIVVKAEPARAFDIFTARIGQWWPRNHSIGASPLQTVTIEPFAGGRWYETGADGAECPWGHVLAWEPPQRLLLAWQIGGDWRFDPDLITELEITLTADGEKLTRIDLEHRNIERLGDRAEAARAGLESPNGWGGVLGEYARCAESRSLTDS